MFQKLRLLPPLVACLIVAACNPFSTKGAIAGRWESSTWTYSKEPVFADFQSDGTLTFLTSMGPHQGKWQILDGGELKVTYRSGSSKTCKVKIEGATLTVSPSACFMWQDLGPSITLQKK